MGRAAGNRDSWWGKDRERTTAQLSDVDSLLHAEPSIPFHPDVLYEDDELIVVDKPPFLPSTPNGRLQANTVQQRLRQRYDEPDIVALHRLDRLTAGVLLLSRNPQTRGAYQRLFQVGDVAKKYECLTVMPDNWDSGESRAADLWLLNTPGQRGVSVVPEGITGAKQASTQVTFVGPVAADIGDVLGDSHGSACACGSCGQVMTVAKWLLEPATGRTHQLRATMNHLDYPILGDDTYPNDAGRDIADFSVTLRLLATSVAFTDPLSGRVRNFETAREVGIRR